MATPEEYVKKQRKKGTIMSKLKKGVTTTTITYETEITNTEEKRIKRELIEPLLKNKDDMGEMLKETNFGSLKNRIDYIMEAQTSDNECLIETSVHGKTIPQTIEEIKESLKTSKTVTKEKYRMLDYLKNKGWEGEKKGEGTISKIKLTITLRV